MRHTSRLLQRLSPVTVATMLACSQAPSPSAETVSTDITGGAPSSDARVVLVVDAKDRYLCSGALVAPDVVVMSGACVLRRFAIPEGREPRAVYVGYSSAVKRDEPLAPHAGAAERIDVVARDGVPSGGSPVFTLVRLATPAATAPFDLATEPPAVGSVCEIVGHGPDDADVDGHVGLQRTANVEISEVALGFPHRIKATPLTGRVSKAEGGAVLTCAGQLTGTGGSSGSFFSVATADSSLAEYVTAGIANLSSSAGAGGAPADAGAPPEPGSPCAVGDEIAHRPCGNCGLQSAICLADPDAGGALTWSLYGECWERDCAPGTIETSADQCPTGTARERYCGQRCEWTSFSLCR
jgi:hypothetical protein